MMSIPRLVTAGALLSVTCVAPVAAARARLSADLIDHKRAGSAAIDVIVHGTKAEVAALAARYNLRVKKSLKSGAVFQVTAGQLDALEQDGDIDHLSGDARIRASDVAIQTIGADQVWAGSDTRPSIIGRGVGVAVIDTGIDARHAALRGRVIVSKDFIGGKGGDGYGHGTHVAGLIAGGGGQASDTREYRGVAPGAWIIDLRVLGDDGSGYASDVIEAIDWAIDHREAYNIRVINLSLGAPVRQSYRDDPLCEAVARAVQAGIVVVAAAGNFGQTKEGKRIVGGITSPGNSPYALTVGALDTHDTPARSDDTVAPYSSRGPTLYDLIVKPDLVAPGSRLASAAAQGSHLVKTYPERLVAGHGTNAYLQLSGTSMAAGVVSGAVALVVELTLGAMHQDLRQVLQATSSFLKGSGILDAGAGELNVAAVATLVHQSCLDQLLITSIAGERVVSGGAVTILLKAGQQALVLGAHLAVAETIGRPGQSFVRFGTVVWSDVTNWRDSSQIMWPVSDSIVWTGSDSDSIVWTGTIVWTNSHDESIVWTGHDGDSIVWTGDDSIVWTGDDSIVWTGHDEDSIVWTGNEADSIVWTGSGNSLAAASSSH
jgi:serine protease AprX